MSLYNQYPSSSKEPAWELKGLQENERVKEILNSLPAQLSRRGAECPACAEFVQFEDFAIPSLLAISLEEKDEGLRRLAIKELGAISTKVVSLMKLGAIDDMDRAAELVMGAVLSIYDSAIKSEDRTFKEDVFTVLSRVGIDPETSVSALLGAQQLTTFTDPFVKLRDRSRVLLREVLEQ